MYQSPRMAEILRVPMPEYAEGSGAGDEWLIAARSNHAALGYRIDLEMPMPFWSRDKNSPIVWMGSQRRAYAGKELNRARTVFGGVTRTASGGLSEVCIIPRFSRRI